MIPTMAWAVDASLQWPITLVNDCWLSSVLVGCLQLHRQTWMDASTYIYIYIYVMDL